MAQGGEEFGTKLKHVKTQLRRKSWDCVRVRNSYRDAKADSCDIAKQILFPPAPITAINCWAGRFAHFLDRQCIMFTRRCSRMCADTCLWRCTSCLERIEFSAIWLIGHPWLNPRCWRHLPEVWPWARSMWHNFLKVYCVTQSNRCNSDLGKGIAFKVKDRRNDKYGREMVFQACRLQDKVLVVPHLRISSGLLEMLWLHRCIGRKIRKCACRAWLNVFSPCSWFRQVHETAEVEAAEGTFAIW